MRHYNDGVILGLVCAVQRETTPWIDGPPSDCYARRLWTVIICSTRRIKQLPMSVFYGEPGSYQ